MLKKHAKIAALAVAPLVALVACQPAEQAGEEAGETANAKADQQKMQDTAAGGMMQGTSVALAPKNQSGFSGTAIFRQAAGDSLRVELRVSGVEQGTTYPTHVHSGSCDSPGGVVAPLKSPAGTAGGTASSSSMVARSALADGQAFVVQVHLADGTPAACGDIPQLPGGESGGATSGGGSGGGS